MEAESSRRTAMDPPVPKRMHKLLSKESLLICHSLLGLRWCFVPFTVLILSRSVLVACQLGGHFAAWSLAVLLADASQRDKESSDWKATISLMLALGLSAAALYCLPLMGLEALAALLVYLSFTAAAAKACALRSGFGRLRAAIFAAWAGGEALLSIAVSAGLLFAASTLLADESGHLERQWVFFWRLLCINCALSVVSFVMLPLLLLRIFRAPKEVYHSQIIEPEMQVIGACTDELPPPSDRRSEPPKSWMRPLFIASAATCLASMVLCTVVFLIFHIITPGQTFESLQLDVPGPNHTAIHAVCETCFCENVVQDVSVIRNVQYGRAYSEKHGRDEDLMLDVYKPDGAKSDSKAPAVLLIHGGNFIGSSRHSDIMVSEAFHFAKAGFVVFNIDYRLDGSTYLVEVAAVRDAVHDAKAAVRFIVDHAESYGVDSTRIAAWGESAGGITAISMNSLSSEGFSGSAGLPSNISAAVSISGTIWPFLVAAPTNDVQRVTPWFNLHSTGDATVFPFLAVMTHVFLLAKGVPDIENRLVWVPGDYHVPWGSHSRLDMSSSLRPVVLNFLAKAMRLKSLCQ